MNQPQPPDPDPDDLEQLGQPIYQDDGLQVRGLTEEDLARFLPPTPVSPPAWSAAAGPTPGRTRRRRMSTPSPGDA